MPAKRTQNCAFAQKGGQVVGTERFRINTPGVVHQTVDNEAILINLETGVYYSLNTTGSAIWNWLAKFAAVSQVSNSLASHYSVPTDSITPQIEQFIQSLVTEGLIVPFTADAALPQLSAQSLNGSYQPPEFERYTDMQEIISLDPIHDVDETGWPAPKA
jgi:hypothetical protein